MCSLLDVIRDDEHEHQLPVNSSATSDIPDVERQSISQIDPPSDPRLARFLTRITVPLYQSFTTATIFGTIVYWAAIFDATNTPLSYHVLVLSAIAPAIAIFDFFLSMRMRFRLVYIPFYILYNAAYALFLWLHARITDTVVYDFLDSTQSQQDFVAKTAGLSIASVVAAFMMYSISLAINACVMHMWPTGEAANKLDKASDNGTTSGNTSKSSSDDSSEEHETGVLLPNNSELCVVVGNEDDLDLSGSFDLMIDRSSAKIHQAKGSMAGSPSAKWFRTGSGRMVKTRSNNSVGMENGGMGIARSDSQNSTWDAWEQPAPRLEDEYFAMPAVYAEQGVEREIVKLKPMPRNDSDRSGRFSRSVSGVSLTRALSGTSLERSGSGSRPSRAGGASVGLGASASARGNMFKSGSGSSLGRSSWRASQEKGRIR